MFGLKLKSWMEAHLGRPRHKSTSHQNQKRAPKDSSTGLACSSGSSANASISSTTNSTSSSSTNTTSSSSNASTTTAIVGGGLAIVANNSTFCNDTSGNKASDHLSHLHHPEKSFNFSSSVTTTSSAKVGALSSASTLGSEPLTVLPGTTVEGQILDRKDGGGGGGGCIAQQKGSASGIGKSDTESRSSGENEHNHQQSAITSTNCIGNNDGGDCRPTVTASTSNSTSILSGSFSNSLSSPDTGYSTDGYSPKSVYPALSFDSGSSSAGNTKSTSSSSKSSYTISSLASSELLHSSKQTTSSSLSSRTSCSIQNGLDEYASVAPSPSSPAALTSSTPFSQSTSSGISSSTTDSNAFPKGHPVHPHHHLHHHHLLENSIRLTQQKQQQQLANNSLQQQHSIPEDDTEKQLDDSKTNHGNVFQNTQQVIMGDGDNGEEKVKRKAVEQTQEQKLFTGTIAETLASAIDPLAKFAQLSIDLKNQEDIIASKHNVRTHRRAESMDARTPCHEEYKPLVEDDTHTGVESNSSFGMTGSSSQGKRIRTSFVINNSGQIVEFSSYKNAYSICSPRRERTRIKTNPWITVNNRSTMAGGSNSEGISHANPVNNGSSEEESVDSKKMNVNSTSSQPPSSSFLSKSVISYGESPLKSSKSSNLVDFIDTRAENEKSGWERVGKGNFARTSNNRGDIGDSDSVSVDPAFTARENLEINNKKEEHVDDDDRGVEEEHFVEDESGIIDHDSSSLLYRISTSASASDSGKGTLEPGTNRNSTESSCLLSDSTTASTRNSIISHEAEHSSSRSGRSSSGESISSSHKHDHDRHHQPLDDDDTLGHASSPSSDAGVASAAHLFTTEHQKQEQHIHQSTTVAKVNSSMNTVTTASSNLNGKGESSYSKGKSTSSTATITESAWSSDEQRTFRNAAVATDHAEISGFPKSSSVSVGVGTTGSNKSGKAFHPVMVDKETDILSDWANTDEDADEDIETDRNDNETVTPAPSSPGTDVDRALFSQSTSSATDIDFGDSSAATQASSTAVFPPSSLVRPHRYNSSSHSNNNSSSRSAFNRENGPKFHNTNNNNENNGFPNGSGSGGSGGGRDEDDAMLSTCIASQTLPGGYDHHQNHFPHQHNINMSLAGAHCYPSVPIIRPVVSAVSQHQGPKGIPDAYAYEISGDLSNHHSLLHAFHPHASENAAMCFSSGGGVVPNFNLDDETDYPEMKEPSSHHKGIARGALGFLRKIFKKGACSSQRHSPDSVKGKKSRGKSDNNLSTIGLGSPLLTISEPLSNPRYSAVLTTKKQMNPALNGYFLTPTPNSFRRKSGTGTDSSDSKSSKHAGISKSVKTDIIRLPQGPLSPQLHQQHTLVQQHRQHQPAQPTSSSHSSGSSCSSTNGIPPQKQQHACSTFLPPPGSTNAHHQLSGILSGENNLVMTTQSNTNTNNSSSTSSSIHSIMSTSTSAASAGINGNHNRPPSQNQSHTPVAHRDPNYYANSSPASRQSSSSSTSNGNNNNNARGNRHSMSPPPLISENCSYLNELKHPSFQPDFHQNGQILHSSSRFESSNVHSQSPSVKGIPPYESPRLSATARMSSPSFNNYSPIHRLVVTGGSHLLNKANSNCSSGGNFSSSGGSAGLSMHYDGAGNNNGNPVGFPINTQIMNRPSTGTHPTAITSPSPLINHRYTATSTPVSHPYSSPMTSSQQQQGHFFASPSPILRNPRYQHITSSNQNSPVLNGSKRMNIIPSSHSHLIQSCSSSSNGLPSNPNGPPPLLTTFAPLPSSSSAMPLAPRESLMNSNSFNTNTITGSPNLNSSDPFNHRVRQVVSTSLSYNEFENLTRQHQSYLFHNSCNNGNTTQHQLFLNSQQHHLNQQHPTSNLLHQQQHHPNIIPHQQQQLLHQSQKSEIHHKNHYYSSAIVKGVQQEALHSGGSNPKQTLWGNAREGRIMMSNAGNNNDSARQYQQKMNQNLRFNSFLVRHRKLPQFYHTQWGLQERIYETVDSEDENSPSDEMSAGGGGGDDDDCEYDQDGNQIDCTSELSLPVEVHRRRLGQTYCQDEVSRTTLEQRESRKENSEFSEDVRKNNDFGCGEGSSLHNENHPQSFTNKKSKRSKPKSLSASGKPLPRPVVALPMMPAGTFLSETETRLLEVDKESDRKYKRLINEAEALLKEISVEKSKRNGDGGRDNNYFRLEDCPQSDPLRRKAYDCWALRRLQQELAGCCASPPVLHRSRLNLQSPSTPTTSNNPYLSHFMSTSQPPIPHPEVSYTSGVDNNQNSFEF